MASYHCRDAERCFFLRARGRSFHDQEPLGSNYWLRWHVVEFGHGQAPPCARREGRPSRDYAGLATELAPHNVTCNIVAPGHIETDRPKSAGPRPSAGTSPPINRLGDVEEIAGMIHYLCLPEADYITGQTMHVNGGVYYGV